MTLDDIIYYNNNNNTNNKQPPSLIEEVETTVIDSRGICWIARVGNPLTTVVLKCYRQGCVEVYGPASYETWSRVSSAFHRLVHIAKQKKTKQGKICRYG